MATFGFKGAYVAKYDESGESQTYNGCVEFGNPIECGLDLKTAEGRLYSGDALSKYRRKITGGSVSITVEDIPTEVRKLVFGEEDAPRTLAGESSKSVTGLKITDKTISPYVGFAAYAPDDVGSMDKFTAIFASKALFSAPGFKFKTMEQQIEFQVPTTVGEFMKAKNGDILEYAVLDTEEDAIAWCKAALGSAAAASVSETKSKSGGAK